ncbi:hypothetical protein GH714_042005 [Hevea brasiliensis]|uniref:ENTH domain-containing protein n=1 Tax=Hevea brasiliensis TaxID=3981 RepID=A0A6A6MU19_HEVBR|nr:hypothetical protein GH714_042005 [Hevea brasiliensis]
MKLWRRATGALKDQRSILLVSLSSRSAYRNPDLEASIIKATNHNDSCIDYRNAQRVFAWICDSPVSLKPLIRALSKRMEKTQSWVVALKGLMLMHGVFCCKTPAVLRIGRLPFDLSHFTDGHSKKFEMWAFNAFVRSYYTICNGIAKLLLGIYSAGKLEASMALKVLQKAISQGEDLALYFEFCSDFGVFNAMEVPKVTHIPEEDIRELERIINGVSDTHQVNNYDCFDDNKATMVREDAGDIVEYKKPNGLKTIITDKWEVFDEDQIKYKIQGNELYNFRTGNPSNCASVPLLPVYKQEIPDLISF